MIQNKININIPRAFLPLLDPKRYKVYYGGRGGAKSHNYARAVLIRGMQKPIRVLCARELQGSIRDSVHKLLADIIHEHRLEYFYKVQKDAIKGTNGTEFFFKGLKHNSTEIKSTEGIDICWVEEAEKVSDSSWEVLIPTIRKDRSEIWVSFNPKFPDDPTYVRHVLNADEDYLLKKVSYRDNPYFPDTLEKERLRLKKEDPIAYAHIWEGEFDERYSGYVYASIIADAKTEGRITNVPHKTGVPVITAWDLGKKHSTCIWFAQVVGLEPRVIDYYEAQGQDTDLDKLAALIRSKSYEYAMHYLPHDGKHDRMGMKKSISEQLKELGIENRITPSVSEESGIEKAKALLKEAWIEAEKCKDGLHALNHFHYEYDENRQRFKKSPYDDWSKDASDAMRYLALVIENHYKTKKSSSSSSLYSARGGRGSGWQSA